jgi:hypothetical protein
VQSSLWGFNGGDTELGNPYRCIHVDMMHQSDLGVFKTLVDILRALTTANLIQMDNRLLMIRRSFRYQSFRLPGTDKGGYFRSNANFGAFEHRAVMQVNRHVF